MALESWELIIFNLAFGSLISGFLLFFFTIFTAGAHFGGGHGGHIGHTLHLGHFGHFQVDHTVQHGHVHHTGKGDQNTSTPILLIISAFLLMFGAIGTAIYQSQLFNPIFRLLSVILFPLIFVKLVTIIWDKLISSEFGYDIPTVSVDNQVKTLTVVDENGGLVLADTGDLNFPETLHGPKTLQANEHIKMSAKTLPGVLIERDNIAYVIDIDQKNTLIIDSWPRIAKKSIQSTEN